MRPYYRLFVVSTGLAAFLLLSGFGLFRHKKYDNPITKDTLQPDKVLFDRAVRDIEKGNYEIARITLNTLINTYDTSEFLAKAKLAIADSWYREGGSHGLGQAEAEYKDFILFYPNMEESAESQYKVCDIHYKQMEKADRDPAQAQRAEDECRQVIIQFPNSKFAPIAQQMLRDTQQVLADKEFKTGTFYHGKGSFPAAANRLSYLAQQYPLYNAADEALWQLADSYKQMGDRFETQEGDALSSIVQSYPLSHYLDLAKTRLTALKRTIPAADPNAIARMKYEAENATRPGIFSRSLGLFSSRPEMSPAAKMGTPAMAAVRPPIPVSVPASAASTASVAAGGISDVSIGQVGDTTAIDQKQDARLSQTVENKASVGSNGQDISQTAPAADPAVAALPTNHPASVADIKAFQKQQARAVKAARKQPKKAAPAAPAATK